VSDVRDSFDVEGRVDLTAGVSTRDMAAAELERARNARVGDVLMVLERNGEELEHRLDGRLADLMPDGVEVRSRLSFETDRPVFGVNVQAYGVDGAAIDRRALTAKLPEAVSGEIGSYIDERATKIGMWEHNVVAALKGPDGRSDGAGQTARGKGAARVLVGVTVGLVMIGAAVAYFRGL
jgi:hypothetical protein